MNVYQIDVKIYGTAYIRAEDEDDAQSKLAGLHLSTLYLDEDLNDEVPVSCLSFDNPELPEVSLSPVMTLYGPDVGAVPSPAGG